MPAAATRRVSRAQRGGNPQTGPFYVEGAMPNDTLVVRLKRVRTNRDWARKRQHDHAHGPRAGDARQPEVGHRIPSRWKIDAAKNVAFLEKPTDTLEGARRSRCSRCSAAWPWHRRENRRSAPRTPALRRQHGLQPDSRRDDDLSAGFTSWRAAVRG